MDSSKTQSANRPFTISLSKSCLHHIVCPQSRGSVVFPHIPSAPSLPHRSVLLANCGTENAQSSPARSKPNSLSPTWRIVTSSLCL